MAELFEKNDMDMIWSATTPVHLLEPERLFRDEGLWGGLRIAFSMARDPLMRRRITAMRGLLQMIEACECVGLNGQAEDPVFPSTRGGRLSRDAIESLLVKYTHLAARSCPSLKYKNVSPHVLMS